MEYKTEQKNIVKRKFVEVEEDIAQKVRLFCFLRNTSMKDFATDTLEKKLKPYEHWLKSVKKFNPNQEYSRDNY